MSKFVLAQVARVKTASGEAQFCLPGTDIQLDNELGGKWLSLPAGTEVEVCAAFPKTHTWMLAVTIPAHEDEDGVFTPALTNGIVLRKLAWEHLVEAIQEPEVEADTEVADEAPAADLAVAAG